MLETTLCPEKRRKHSSCTGVFMECHGSITRVLTSASLVRTSGEENSIQPGLKVGVASHYFLVLPIHLKILLAKSHFIVVD